MDTKTLKLKMFAISPAALKWLATMGAIGAVVVLGFVFRDQWLPRASAMAASLLEKPQTAEEEGHGGHEGHDHGHAGHDEANSLELSPQARKNIGLTTAPIKLETFTRTVSMPARVIGRPGRSQIEVTAPLGGRVTRVYPVEGDAVETDQPLFDLRLTHEELVKAQSEFLRAAEELDVVQREIKRLESVEVPGAIPGKRKLEREYERQKIEANLNAQKQSLLLHGLTDEQVEFILKDHKLVDGTTVFAPEHPKNGDKPHDTDHPFTVKTLHVKPGQYVEAGAPLCLLMDYAHLFIEGRAFEQDADELLTASRERWEITAVPEDGSEKPRVIDGLKIVYIDSEVETVSRALHFYVGLPNEIVNESKSDDGHRFVAWRYKPGQRMQLRVPVEQWENRIVLPIDAVAREGAEFYVFQQNGDHFDRVPVQVEYQDQFSAVVANDGSVFPGQTVAMSGAHQLQMALKNKAGGGVDPHAGHNH